MPDYLRLTPEEYEAVEAAALTASLSGGYSRLRRDLTEALRAARPELAEFVAGLCNAQLRLLRDKLERREKELSTAPGYQLSFPEWKVVARSAALVRLRGDQLTPTALVGIVADESPALADKLAGLSIGRLARLFHALHSGQRCCLA